MYTIPSPQDYHWIGFYLGRTRKQIWFWGLKAPENVVTIISEILCVKLVSHVKVANLVKLEFSWLKDGVRGWWRTACILWCPTLIISFFCFNWSRIWTPDVIEHPSSHSFINCEASQDLPRTLADSYKLSRNIQTINQIKTCVTGDWYNFRIWI